MDQNCLQVLLEFDAGEFHAFQCERSRFRHQTMMDALNLLLKEGYVGDEILVTEKARSTGKSGNLTATHRR